MKVLSELRYLPRAHDGEHWFLYSQIDALIKAEFVEKFKLAVFHSPFKAGFGDENESYSAVTRARTFLSSRRTRIPTRAAARTRRRRRA